MSYERKDGDIVLFQNDNRKNEKAPTMKGELLLGGVTYEVAMWTKLDRNAKKFLAGTAKVKGQKPVGRTPRESEEITEDEIPF